MQLRRAGVGDESHCLGWSRSHLTRSSTTRRHVRAQSFLVMCVSAAQSCMHCAYHSAPRLRICSGESAPAGLYTAPGEFFFAVAAPVSNWAYPTSKPSRTSKQTATNNRMTSPMTSDGNGIGPTDVGSNPGLYLHPSLSPLGVLGRWGRGRLIMPSLPFQFHAPAPLTDRVGMPQPGRCSTQPRRAIAEPRSKSRSPDRCATR